jgi:hypothetical protein
MKMRSALLIALTLAGCAGNVPLDDLSIAYHWRDGTKPPPYHYEYDITLDRDGKGVIKYRPDYSAPPEWVEEYAATAEAMARVRQAVADAGVFTRQWRERDERSVGGSYAWMEAKAAGRGVKTPAFPESGNLGDVYRAVEETVPASVWSSLKERREKYMAEHPRK